MRHRIKRAFTLVEILIVVVILGILAAIVVPQFTNASTEAQAGNAATQLQTIRSQIELYRVRHNGNYPDLLANQWADLTGDDYMRAAPVNPRTNSSTVGAAEAPDVGWVFTDSNGDGIADTITCAYFDEVAYADGDPNTPAWTGP